MIIGHQKQIDFLRRAIKEKNLSHAYLFCGQEGLGKKKVAWEVFSPFFNSNPKHPDFISVEPQGKEIQISQIKETIHRLSFKCSSEIPFKVAIINEAHLMNQEAQTCLLKTLEEPKGEAVIILISHHERYLFPAVRSRTQAVKFNPVEKKEITEYFLKEGFPLEKAEEISEISLGRPGKALQIAAREEDPDGIERILKSPLFSRFRLAKRLSEDPEKARKTLELWTLYLRRRLLKALAENQPTLALRRMINLTEETNFLMSTTNINPKLALESLMFEM